MKKSLMLIGLLLFPTLIFSQVKMPGRWSLLLDAGIISSPSSNQTLDNFLNQFAIKYEASAYPFDKVSGSLGGKIFYTFPESKFSPYLGCELNILYNSVILDNDNNYASMLVTSWSLGVEYLTPIIGDNFRFLARIGLTSNIIVGNINYQYYYYTKISPAVRFGYEIETGADYLIPGTPLSAELSLGYANSNLIGKSYTPPATLRNSNILRETALNDGSSANHPEFSDKTLDLLWLRLGARLWF